MEGMIEVAQAICKAEEPNENPDASAGYLINPGWLIWQQYIPAARAAIEAHDAWLKENGLVVVPREPDRKMLSAGGFYFIQGAGGVSESDMGAAKRTFAAMIDAALQEKA